MAVAVETDQSYLDFLKEQHPVVKAAHPTWTPQQIIVAIGHKWSCEKMTLEKKGTNLVAKHRSGKFLIDGCGKVDELRAYLEAYRAKYGHEEFFSIVKKLETPVQG